MNDEEKAQEQEEASGGGDTNELFQAIIDADSEGADPSVAALQVGDQTLRGKALVDYVDENREQILAQDAAMAEEAAGLM